jgi:cytochrome c-type biogenesis protein CcmH/NrfG
VLVQLARLRIERREYDRAILQLEKFLALEPDSALGHNLIGTAFRRSGEPRLAMLHFAEAGRLSPRDWTPVAGMAWIRATSSDPSLRNGARAVELAEHASLLAETQNAIVLETLAAAHAADGRSERAVALVVEALDVLPPERHGDRARLKRQLRTYREGSALVDPRE